MEYEHVQYGYFGAGTIALMVAMGVFSLPESFAESPMTGWVVAGTLVAISVIVSWFSRLAVTIERGTLTASFGPGWPRRTIDLSEVAHADAVRNSWIQGWGIRRISGGWMYNVWGLDAVEFTMGSGDVARVGTNDLDNLLGTVRVYTN